MKISSTLSLSLFFVNALTTGTITIETAIAATPISGDLEAAAEKPELMLITSVEIPTTKSPERIPA